MSLGNNRVADDMGVQVMAYGGGALFPAGSPCWATPPHSVFTNTAPFTWRAPEPTTPRAPMIDGNDGNVGNETATASGGGEGARTTSAAPTGAGLQPHTER